MDNRVEGSTKVPSARLAGTHEREGDVELTGADRCRDRTPIVGTGKVNLCLVAHLAYGALTGGSAGHIGGVERQTTLMARWLAARGHG